MLRLKTTKAWRTCTIQHLTQVLCAISVQLLKDLHNFNTMMSVDAALQHTAVERLKKTFELMSDRKVQVP